MSHKKRERMRSGAETGWRAQAGRSMALWASIVLGLTLAGTMARAEGAGQISHFSSPDGEVGFVLDLSGERPLMRVDESIETFILSESLGPRGDTLYKLTNNYLILRRNNVGSYTLYDRFFPDGRPVQSDGPARSLELRPVSLQVAKEQAESVAFMLSKRIGRPLKVAALDWGNVPGNKQGAAVLNDAIKVTAAALRRLSFDAIGQEALRTGLDEVIFVPSQSVSYEVTGRTLNIYYVWQNGYEGRPASNDIFRHLEFIL